MVSSGGRSGPHRRSRSWPKRYPQWKKSSQAGIRALSRQVSMISRIRPSPIEFRVEAMSE